MTGLRPRMHVARLMPRTLPTSYVLWGMAIFVLAFTLRLLWINYLDPYPAHDGFAYWGMAQAFADGHGLVDIWHPGHFAMNRAPGWPVTLGVLVFFVGPNLLAAKVLNVVLGSITAVGVFAAGAVLRDQRTGIVGGVLMAFFPSQIFFTTTLMGETFFVALAILLVLVMMLWLRSDGQASTWKILALGLLVGFMTLVKAETIVLLPAMAMLWKLFGQRWRQVAHLTLLLGIGMAVVITPWTIRNYIRFDTFILVRSAGNGQDGIIRSGLSPDYELHSQPGGPPPPTFAETFDYYASITGPWRILSLGGHKLYDFYGHDDSFHWKITPDFASGSGQMPALPEDVADRWSALGNAYYWMIGAVALLGVPLWFDRRNKRLHILLWFMASWSLFYMVTVPKVRYHHPILPMVTVLAAATLVIVWDKYAVHLIHRARGAEEQEQLEVSRPVASPAGGSHEEVRA